MKEMPRAIFLYYVLMMVAMTFVSIKQLKKDEEIHAQKIEKVRIMANQKIKQCLDVIQGKTTGHRER
jgi:Zn-finger domain-containing protein